jgi:hypothetical protein
MLNPITMADAAVPLALSPAALAADQSSAAFPVPRNTAAAPATTGSGPRTGARTAPFGTDLHAPQRRTRAGWTTTPRTTSSKFVQMARIAPTGGGALGSHPARDPV